MSVMNPTLIIDPSEARAGSIVESVDTHRDMNRDGLQIRESYLVGLGSGGGVNGLFTTKPLKEGDIVGAYTGLYIDADLFELWRPRRCFRAYLHEVPLVRADGTPTKAYVVPLVAALSDDENHVDGEEAAFVRERLMREESVMAYANEAPCVYINTSTRTRHGKGFCTSSIPSASSSTVSSGIIGNNMRPHSITFHTNQRDCFCIVFFANQAISASVDNPTELNWYYGEHYHRDWVPTGTPASKKGNATDSNRFDMSRVKLLHETRSIQSRMFGALADEEGGDAGRDSEASDEASSSSESSSSPGKNLGFVASKHSIFSVHPEDPSFGPVCMENMLHASLEEMREFANTLFRERFGLDPTGLFDMFDPEFTSVELLEQQKNTREARERILSRNETRKRCQGGGESSGESVDCEESMPGDLNPPFTPVACDRSISSLTGSDATEGGPSVHLIPAGVMTGRMVATLQSPRKMRDHDGPVYCWGFAKRYRHAVKRMSLGDRLVWCFRFDGQERRYRFHGELSDKLECSLLSNQLWGDPSYGHIVLLKNVYPVDVDNRIIGQMTKTVPYPSVLVKVTMPQASEIMQHLDASSLQQSDDAVESTHFVATVPWQEDSSDGSSEPPPLTGAIRDLPPPPPPMTKQECLERTFGIFAFIA